MAPRGQNRDKLIEAMQTLSLCKGFPATTVDEVCAEAGVSKGSFYHHFDSKDDVGHAALDGFFKGLVGGLTTGPFTPIDDPVQRLHAFVKNAGEVCAGPLLQSGCMLGSLAPNLAESDAPIQGAIVLGKVYAAPQKLVAGVDLFGDHLELIFSRKASR
ncbi:MAG: TetR/AcrR family transcriptional repressor of nem operon [Myxococcota bacterium]|jgi:TetR/AcrR family transcriptional repressor of nem operon